MVLKYAVFLLIIFFSCTAQEKNSGITIDDQVVEKHDKTLITRDSEFCQIVLGAEQKEEIFTAVER